MWVFVGHVHKILSTITRSLSAERCSCGTRCTTRYQYPWLVDFADMMSLSLQSVVGTILYTALARRGPFAIFDSMVQSPHR